MKYLCLAYGDGKDWEVSSEAEKVPTRSPIPFAQCSLPLVGFSIIEAESIEQAVDLVADTPCARAKGAIEIRPPLT